MDLGVGGSSPLSHPLPGPLTKRCQRAVLIDDVCQRGEFGRTPKINGTGGRDHWPDCYSVVLAGGGIAGGTIYGASDKLGAYPDSNPVTPGDLAATVFWRFGLDPATELHDAVGRPFRLAASESIYGLFG